MRMCAHGTYNAAAHAFLLFSLIERVLLWVASKHSIASTQIASCKVSAQNFSLAISEVLHIVTLCTVQFYVPLQLLASQLLSGFTTHWNYYGTHHITLTRVQVQVHQLGPLWQLVRASMTIVGMVPPVIRDGDMLVDGGYLNNLPVDVMHSLGVHTVLVVRSCCQLRNLERHLPLLWCQFLYGDL
jgi:hypothetical protein